MLSCVAYSFDRLLRHSRIKYGWWNFFFSLPKWFYFSWSACFNQNVQVIDGDWFSYYLLHLSLRFWRRSWMPSPAVERRLLPVQRSGYSPGFVLLQPWVGSWNRRNQNLLVGSYHFYSYIMHMTSDKGGLNVVIIFHQLTLVRCTTKQER